MKRKFITLILALVVLINIVPSKIMASGTQAGASSAAIGASDYWSSLRRDVLFTATDTTNERSLTDVNYRIYQGDNYRIDLGVTTGGTRLEPGRYTVTATKDGFNVGTIVIDVSSGRYGTQTFNFRLNRDRSYTDPWVTPTSNTVFLSAKDANTGYNISDVRYYIEDLNNSNKNQTVYSSSVSLSTGNYRISAIKEGYTTQSKNVYMTGSRQDVSFNLSRSTQYSVRDVRITNVSLYINRVIGNTSPYARVSLYNSGSFVRSVNADSTGYFDLANEFKVYDYKGEYYRGTRIYPDISTNRRVSGYTTANTPILVYDANDVYLGRTTSDSRGYYSLDHAYISNTNGKLILKDFNENYLGNYDDFSNYYLVAEKDGYTSARYYLTDLRIKGFESVYIPNEDYIATAPIILEASGGESFVRGQGATPFATITIRDASGITLGSTVLDYDAKFAIRTNRPLILGELLNITTSHERYNDKISSIVVGSVTGVEKPSSPYNYKNQFTIGSKSFVQTVEGKSTTKYMDVAPYIKDGRTMLPIRFVAEVLDYEVEFDNSTKNAVFLKGTTSLIINLNSRDFYVNGQKFTLSVDPVTVDGRIMLPVSELGRALGLTTGNIGEGKNIEWDPINRIVNIQVYK